MTWRELAEKIAAMPEEQLDQPVLMVRDYDGPDQDVVGVVVAKADHEIWNGISIGNEKLLDAGAYCLVEQTQ